MNNITTSYELLTSYDTVVMVKKIMEDDRVSVNSLKLKVSLDMDYKGDKRNKRKR